MIEDEYEVTLNNIKSIRQKLQKVDTLTEHEKGLIYTALVDYFIDKVETGEQENG
jgi:hypothetical protein